MTQLLLTLCLLAAPAPDAAPPTAIPALAGAPAPAPFRTESTLPPPEIPTLGPALPAACALLALAALALLLSRRRAPAGRRMVQLLDSVSLGPKRQLVVVRMRDDLLLLGSSEAGVTLLSTQPAPELAAASLPSAPTAAGSSGDWLSHALTRLWSGLRGRARPAPAASFDDLLHETTDDLELRRKLASGRAGKVA
jgi:flagellar biogenesis protein FliO